MIHNHTLGHIIYASCIMSYLWRLGSVRMEFIVCWSTMLQAGSTLVWFPLSSFNFFNLRNPSSCIMAMGLTQFLTEMSTRKFFWEVKCGWCVRLTTSPPSLSWFSRKCGILDITQPCRPLCPTTGIVLFILLHYFIQYYAVY
jgi:hypothetical protein